MSYMRTTTGTEAAEAAKMIEIKHNKMAVRAGSDESCLLLRRSGERGPTHTTMYKIQYGYLLVNDYVVSYNGPVLS